MVDKNKHDIGVSKYDFVMHYSTGSVLNLPGG